MFTVYIGPVVVIVYVLSLAIVSIMAVNLISALAITGSVSS